MNDDLTQITEWDNPDELMATQWGTIRYGAWLVLEAKRWMENGRTAEVRTQRSRQALFGKIPSTDNEQNH